MKTVKRLLLTVAGMLIGVLLSAFSGNSEAISYLSDGGLSGGQPIVSATNADGPDAKGPLCIGKSEKIFELDQAGICISGMAYGEDGSDKCLYILDRNSKQILVYSISPDSESLTYKSVIPLKKARLTNPRGLAYSKENNSDVFYFLDYAKIRNTTISRLYRYDSDRNDLTYVSLTDKAYDIETKEVFGLTMQNDNIFLSFDPSDYPDQVVRIRRGILKMSVSDNSGQP
ncbi:MAG: hypothetical protein IH591_01090, partial [Bacteroidales bacterium]|nr:hypothetical protein [Bacteroidales bacterium]